MWPMGGLQVIKSVIYKWLWNPCKLPRAARTRMRQLEAPLPNTRVNSAHPFQYSGVDGCGPFLVCPTIPSDDPENPKKSKRVIKFYILQFVFFYYRCLHLEVLIAPISAENVLQAIQRFVARRGKIDFWYSDNHQSFLAARTQISKLHEALQSRKVIDSTTTDPLNIKWVTSTPQNPNTNAVNEASVKISKTAFKRSSRMEHWQCRRWER